STPFYAFTYTQPFHSIIVGTTTAVSFFSNSLLIYIVFTTSAEHIGSYRYLLIFFSICNLTTTISHVSFEWFCHMTTSGFYFFPRTTTGFIFGVPWATVFCVLFIMTYYQVFLILAFHFVYRFKTVTRGIIASFTDEWKTPQWILAAMIAYVLYISGFVNTVGWLMTPSDQMRQDAPPEIFKLYNVDFRDPHTGFIAVAWRRLNHTTNEIYWSVSSVMAMVNHMILFGGTGAVIVYCIYKTSSTLKTANTLMTARTRKMHRQLFRALLIQTTIPCIFSYFPLTLILLFGGLTGISLGAFGNILFITTAIFPAVDALFVLFFIVKFRIAVIKLFRLPFKTGMGSSVEHR
ncbi:hypothetical protein PENTCL1PPCAC_16012, partial [Pristionchus entomophagus]